MVRGHVPTPALTSLLLDLAPARPRGNAARPRPHARFDFAAPRPRPRSASGESCAATSPRPLSLRCSPTSLPLGLGGMLRGHVPTPALTSLLLDLARARLCLSRPPDFSGVPLPAVAPPVQSLAPCLTALPTGSL